MSTEFVKRIQPTGDPKGLPIDIFTSKKSALEVPIRGQAAEDLLLNSAVYAMDSGVRAMFKTGMKHYEDFSDGKIDGAVYTGKIFKEGITATATGGAKAATAFGIKEGMVALSKYVRWAGFRRFARSNSMVAIAFGVVDQGVDHYKYSKGKLTLTQYQVRTSENVGATSGAITGSATGAIIGSAVPGLGTVMGSALGAMFGAYMGAAGGRSFGEKYFVQSSPGASPEEPEDKKEEGER